MDESPKDPAAGAAAPLIILGLWRRLRRRRARFQPEDNRRRRSEVARSFGSTVVSSFFKGVIYSVLLVAYLIIEVFVAMLIYMYINLNHLETFGRLTALSRQFLDSFATNLEWLSPELANQAYATVLGELGAKSVLLLFIGLIVSTLIRFVVWFFHKGMETARTRSS